MTITTNMLNQQAQYQQDYHHGRKISLSKNQAPLSREPATNTLQPNNQQRITTVTIEQLQTLSGSFSVSEQQNIEAIQEDIYDRPLTGRVKMMKLILESTFGESITFVRSNLSNRASSLGIEAIPSEVSSLNGEVPVNQEQQEIQLRFGQQTFNSNDRLTVEEWQLHQQELSYNMQGEFDINGQHLSLDYSFYIASKKIQYNSFETTAAALKDPLIVQFGNQSIGEISGQESFDINQDNKMDNLPVFSGDVGYLVYDKNGNNKADNGSELFGPTSGNGFNELAQLDENNNGFLDKEDSAYQQLYIWQPDNSTWLSLADAGIEAISTQAIATPYTFYDKNDEVQAQLRNSSFAISESGRGFGVHQVDVRI